MDKKEVSFAYARSRIALGLRYVGPRGAEREDLDKLYPGSKVLVYQTKTKKWEGPFTFIDKSGETVCVQQPKGRQIFRSNVVKPAPAPDEVNRLFSAAFSSTDFSESRKKENKGLFDRKVFKIVNRSTVAKGVRIYGHKWQDSVKHRVDGSSYLKSRLCAQNYLDQGATGIATRSPTITRWTQRLGISLAAMRSDCDAFSRDITQAYVQSGENLRRDIYIEPQPEMGLGPDKVVQAVKPLYSVPESGLFWYETYHKHHKETLGMSSSEADPCFLYKKSDSSIVPNFVMLQVDDSLGCGNKSFLGAEEKGSIQFECKPRDILKNGDRIMFNGSLLVREKDDMYKMSQPKKLNCTVPKTKKDLVSTRAALQYIAGCTRPDIAGPVQLLAKKVT